MSSPSQVLTGLLYSAQEGLLGLPPIVIQSSFILYVLIFLVIIITGFSIWISKCYNVSIKLAILLALLLQTWIMIYFYFFIGENSTLEEALNAIKTFLYLIVVITIILLYGIYKQITGKCGLLPM